MDRQIGFRDFNMWGNFSPYAWVTWYGARARRAEAANAFVAYGRHHNSRTKRRSIFKLGGGIGHVTRHVWPLFKVKRSNANLVNIIIARASSRGITAKFRYLLENRGQGTKRW